MAGVHPLGDLAPRDIVARRVWQAQQEGRVWLDARAVTGDWSQRFPTVLAACRAHGFDPRHRPLPVTPVAHFHMGGVAVDADGATSLSGLYAVGEVACTGAHGANRLASNSLLEGVACGRKIGARLSGLATSAPRGASHWFERGVSLAPAQLERLRALMWLAAGPQRDGTSLRSAVAECASPHAAGWQARLASALFAAALQRRESLGAHCRTDVTATMRYRMAVVN
jgi:L-aspartate oxidase